ncbi:hypothetical protein E2320_023039, partial [Naja naja]
MAAWMRAGKEKHQAGEGEEEEEKEEEEEEEEEEEGEDDGAGGLWGYDSTWEEEEEEEKEEEEEGRREKKTREPASQEESKAPEKHSWWPSSSQGRWAPARPRRRPWAKRRARRGGGGEAPCSGLGPGPGPAAMEPGSQASSEDAASAAAAIGSAAMSATSAAPPPPPPPPLLPVPVVWSPEVEVCLFHAMLGHKPVGVNRHFHMICIRDKFSQNIGRQISSKVIWDHLSTMYDMQALHESEILPFPNSEKNFILPEEIIQEVKEGKVMIEDDVKEEIKEEMEAHSAAEEGILIYERQVF